MLKHPRKVRLKSDSDVTAAVDAVVNDGTPRMLIREGELIAVVVSPADFAELEGDAADGVWADYSPERARRALEDATGVFRGIDTDQLKRDLRAARGQSSSGRRE